ncbi:hypothetical protein B5V01_26205 [Mesorhizobium erdmanii]|uniref:Transposase InsH N-terminal domain-containing protein n=2 Tax=Mesorhizobium TaxID=68287 RepID=A0A3M9WZZ1_9HYPH|nr:hypothetical protein DNR46_35785 [Mesorhizobium japonicum]RXT39484.1 hypothetical protein B5V01_26205 [Mesorhizobium erdmanii]
MREAANAGTGGALGHEHYLRLSEAGDPLEKLNAVVPWEVFRPLGKALKRSDGAKGGPAALRSGMMFKIMVLQALCKHPARPQPGTSNFSA